MRWHAPDWAAGERGRFLRASAIGAVAAVLLFAWLGARGRVDLLEWQRSGNFYDAQAESWLDGTWQVSGGILGIERFESHGGTYMYQGPWPALLRMPVVAVTDTYDGRLSLLSMLVGVLVAAAATTRLHWRIRSLMRGDVPVTRGDLWTAAAATFAMCGGSALLYEASRPWVYHEAAVWGAAWSIAAIDAAIGCVTRPSRRRFLWAALTTTLALTSRGSVGLAGTAALAILCGGNILARLRAAQPSPDRGLARWLAPLRSVSGSADASGRLPVLAPGLAAAAPIAVYAAINWIKFRTLFSIPFWGQGFTILDAKRQAFLAANDGTLFGLKFAPTTFVQYVRPDALSFTRTYPFVDFPAKATPIGGVEFDLIDYSSSVPSAMPALTVLAIVGAFVMFRRSDRAPGTGLSALRGPTLGALAGALTILPFGYIANRYLVDALPVLAIAGLVGLQVVLARTRGAAGARRRLPWVGLGLLALAGLWINLSHGLLFQRLYSPNVKDDLVAGFLDTRYDIGQRAGLDPPIPIMEVGEYDDLPLDVPRGQVAVVGDCKAMYLSDGLDLNAVKFTPWNPIERTEAGGRYLLEVDFPIQPPGTRLPLFSMHSSEGDGQLYAEWRGGAGVVFEYRGPGEAYPSRTWYLPPGVRHTMDLVVDPRMNFVQVFLGDKMYYENLYLAPNDATIDLGVDTLDDPRVEDSYSGSFELLPERVGVCEELVREAAER
jgi:hypothetical protein